MARYRKPVRIPFPDEEPDFDSLPAFQHADNLDIVIDLAMRDEREQVGGYYDRRRVGKVA